MRTAFYLKYHIHCLYHFYQRASRSDSLADY
jgi:hypothetical protein